MATSLIVFDMIEVVDIFQADEDHRWCPSCQLPSGVTIVLASQVRGCPLRLSTRTRCDDCHRTLP